MNITDDIIAKTISEAWCTAQRQTRQNKKRRKWDIVFQQLEVIRLMVALGNGSQNLKSSITLLIIVAMDQTT